MARFIPLIAALLIVIRPFAGCCECHAPLAAVLAEVWQEMCALEHTDDCCDHSGPCSTPDHQDGKCPSCESTKDFVKVVAPQLAKTSLVWHFGLPVAADGKTALPDPLSRHSQGPLSSSGLRAHLVLGVMLI